MDKLGFMTESKIPVYFRATGTPIVSVRVVCNAGSVHEKIPGTAHFLEHMFFKGTERLNSEEINRALAKLGNSNAYTTMDRTVFYINTTQENVVEALSLLLEMLCQPTLDPAEMEKERRVILEEFQTGQDDPMHYFFSQAGQFVFQGPNGRSIIGDRASIDSITVQDLHDYRKANYTRENLAITIIGGSAFNLDTVVDAIAPFEKYLGSGNPNRIDGSIKQMGNWEQPLSLNVEHAASQAGILMYLPWITPEQDIETKFAAGVLSNMLGQGSHSLLFQKLREESGLCYATGAYASGVWYDLAFAVYALLSPENVEQAKQEMLQVVKRVTVGDFDDDLLQIARSNALFSLASATEKASGWAKNYSDSYFYYAFLQRLDLMQGGLQVEHEAIYSMSLEELRGNVVKVAQTLLKGCTFVTMNAGKVE